MTRKCLIIDDDPQFGKFLCKGLQKAGYEVIFTTSGGDALNSWEQIDPDLILTDIIMPDNEGIEIIMQIRNAGYTKPIIAMSGFSAQSSDYLEAAKVLGANAGLTKPFTLEDIQSISDQLCPDQ